MNKKLLLTMFFAVIVLGFAGGIMWLAQPPEMPATQTVEQTIPDDHIPR